MKTTMMATEENVHAYFSSINSLAKKIMEEKEKLMKTYGDDWNQLSFEKQEEILDNYIVDSTVREKYEDVPELEDIPECFPKLMIESGEKIYVDFENDGWTWQDEHSGPFSWETKSQMNFEMNGNSDKPRKPSKKKHRAPPPPDTANGNEFAFKPEKSIWDSPFLAADRGFDSGYPSSQASEEQSSKISDRSDDNEDLFQKYGITFTDKPVLEYDSIKEKDDSREGSEYADTPTPPPRRSKSKKSESDDHKKDNGFLAELSASVLKNHTDNDQNGSEQDLLSGFTKKQNSGKFRRSPSKEKEKKKDKESVKYSHLSESDDISRRMSYDGPAAEEQSLVKEEEEEDKISTLTSELSLGLENSEPTDRDDRELSPSAPRTGFSFLDDW